VKAIAEEATVCIDMAIAPVDPDYDVQDHIARIHK
jgi:hypothetical protein